MKKFLPPSCFAALLMLTMAPAYSQTPPDAGSVRQEIQNKREPVEPKEAAPASVPPPTSVDAPAEASVTVKSFRFTGNTLISERELSLGVEQFRNRPLTFAELQKAVSTVADIYR